MIIGNSAKYRNIGLIGGMFAKICTMVATDADGGAHPRHPAIIQDHHAMY